MTTTEPSDTIINEPSFASPNSDEDVEFHEQAHRRYRAAKNYVDASLREDGYKPQVIRSTYPGQYAAAVRRTLRELKT